MAFALRVYALKLKFNEGAIMELCDCNSDFAELFDSKIPYNYTGEKCEVCGMFRWELKEDEDEKPLHHTASREV